MLLELARTEIRLRGSPPTKESLRSKLMNLDEVEVELNDDRGHLSVWRMTGRELFAVVWNWKNIRERKWHRRIVERAAREHDCGVLVLAYDDILTNADPNDVSLRQAGCRVTRPSRAGAAILPAGAALAATILAAQAPGAEGSSLWLATTVSLSALPLVSYVSWLMSLRVAWDVTSAVSEEAVEAVKTIGAEARSAAETVGVELRSWMMVGSAPVRGTIFVAVLMLGAFAIWLLAVALRKFWPTWPTPYAHAQRIEDKRNDDERKPPGYPSNFSLAKQIRERGRAARGECLQNLELKEDLQLAARQQLPRKFKVGAVVSFIYAKGLRKGQRRSGEVSLVPPKKDEGSPQLFELI